MSLHTLTHSTALTDYLAFVVTHMDRDKIMRCLQYWGRFYTWYLARRNASKEQLRPWEKLRDQFMTVRKVLRFGQVFASIRTAVTTAQNKAEDPVYRALMAGKHASFATYLVFDGMGVLDSLGIWALPKNVNKRAIRELNRWWGMGLLFSALAQLYKLTLISDKTSTMDKDDPETASEYQKLIQDRTVARAQIVCDIFDITSPAAFLGWAKFDEGLIGLTGIFSSMLNVSSQWSRLAE